MQGILSARNLLRGCYSAWLSCPYASVTRGEEKLTKSPFMICPPESPCVGSAFRRSAACSTITRNVAHRWCAPSKNRRRGLPGKPRFRQVPKSKDARNYCSPIRPHVPAASVALRILRNPPTYLSGQPMWQSRG